MFFPAFFLKTGSYGQVTTGLAARSPIRSKSSLEARQRRSISGDFMDGIFLGVHMQFNFEKMFILVTWGGTFLGF